MKLVLIESPYRASTEWELSRNLAYLRALMFDCVQRGEAPLAMHGLLTQVFDDRIPEERRTGIRCHLAWARVADMIIVGIDGGVSPGMIEGIKSHERDGIVVEQRSLPGWREAWSDSEVLSEICCRDHRNYLEPLWIPSGVTVPPTPDQREAQRRSFVYGNTKLADDNVTREMVDEVADESSSR